MLEKCVEWIPSLTFLFSNMMLLSRCKLVHLACIVRVLLKQRLCLEGHYLALMLVGKSNYMLWLHGTYTKIQLWIDPTPTIFWENVRICLASKRRSLRDHVLSRKKYHHLNHLNDHSLILSFSLSLSRIFCMFLDCAFI